MSEDHVKTDKSSWIIYPFYTFVHACIIQNLSLLMMSRCCLQLLVAGLLSLDCLRFSARCWKWCSSCCFVALRPTVRRLSQIFASCSDWLMSISADLRWLDRNKWRALCHSKNSNNIVISHSIALKRLHFTRNLSRNNTYSNM